MTVSLHIYSPAMQVDDKRQALPLGHLNLETEG